MKKILATLLVIGNLLLITGCSQVGLIESRGLVPARVTDLQTNGYLNFSNIFFYLDIDDNGNFSQGTDITLAYKDGTLVLPDVIGSLANTTAVVRIEPKNAGSKKTYRLRNTADTSWVDVICTQGFSASPTTDASTAGWFTRFGSGTATSKWNYKPFNPGTAISVKVTSNPTQLSVALEKKETNGTIDLNQMDFYLDTNGDGSFSNETDAVIELKDGKLVLPDMTGNIAENTSAPILIKPKDGSAVKYSFISEKSWMGIVFANILEASPTTDATQDGWYQRYNQGTEASAYTHSALTSTYMLYVIVDNRIDDDPGDPTIPPENPENPSGGSVGIKVVPVQSNGYVSMDSIEFYFDVNNNKSYDVATDLLASYTDEKIIFPDVTGKVLTGESRLILVKPKSNLSKKTYGTRNSADTAGHDILYLNNKDGKTGWFTCQQSTTNYNTITDELQIAIKALSNPANLSAGLAIKRYEGTTAPTANEKVFDITKIDFYLDVDKSDSYTTGDVTIEYKDGKLVLPDLISNVPLGEYRQVLMKSKLTNSLRRYGFKQGNNNMELVLANIVPETTDTNGTGDAWYRRYPNNKEPNKMYVQLLASTQDITVTITNKETVLPIRSSTVTDQGAPIDKLEFYIDRDNNQEFSEGDNTLEYVEHNGTWNMALPDKAENNISVSTGEFRRVMVKPYEGKTYHFVASADPTNLGGYKSIVLRPDTDTNKTWLLASSATSSFAIGPNLVYVRIFSATGEKPQLMQTSGVNTGKIP